MLAYRGSLARCAESCQAAVAAAAAGGSCLVPPLVLLGPRLPPSQGAAQHSRAAAKRRWREGALQSELGAAALEGCCCASIRSNAASE